MRLPKLKFFILLIITLSIYSCRILNTSSIISGTIKDGKELVVGSEITNKRTKNKSTSDFDGEYAIKAKKGDTLVFTFLDSKKEIIVDKSKIINVALEVYKYPEIIIQSGNIKRNEINPNKNYESLTIVNGNILHKDVLEAIDPKNIESVNVLKDKAATAVYGQSAKNGVILITTKDISKRELKKLYKKYSSENSINKETDVFKISGTVYDCEKLELSGVYIKNLNSKAETQTDIDGKFSIEVKINDILEISFLQFKSQKIKIENKENLIVNLKAEQQIILEKPVIYLYPTEKKAIDIKLDLKGELLTTFPKYDKSWEVIAEPNGQIFDKKTNRYYSSLFWDGTIDFPSAHYKYDDGFIVSKDNLTEFLIKKLDHIGLNNQETNEFIQYWLPILERNKYNFIHFLVNEECNEIATLNVNPKPETSIRIYMEFYGLENRTIIKEQQLPKTERKGFTLVEWGGADFTGEMSEEDFFKINDLPILNGITLICKRRDINDIKPLYVIDNKISSKRIFDRLNPSEIKKIETFSGKDGVALYGSDGVGGIFIITTKNPKK